MSAMKKIKPAATPAAAPKKGTRAATKNRASDNSARSLSKEQLMNVLLAPHVSEKSARVAQEGNQVVFRVRNDATRTHVKDAVEFMFDVKVAGVQVLNQPGKKRRFGRIEGFRSGHKKAYVRLAAGQTIDFATGGKP
jgi:large subunit ribosomal protein L23